MTIPGTLEGIDPHHWLRLGCGGLWILVVSLLALRDGAWPRALAYVGIGTAIAHWLAVAGIVFQIASVVMLIAGVGAIVLAPLWYIWLGLRLRKAG